MPRTRPGACSAQGTAGGTHMYRALRSRPWKDLALTHRQSTQQSRAKSMKSWKLRLQEGGRTCPGNGMNSGLRLFLLSCHGDGGGRGRHWVFPFQGPTQHRHPCKRCLRPGHQRHRSPGQALPAPSDPGVQSSSFSPFRAKNASSQPGLRGTPVTLAFGGCSRTTKSFRFNCII